VPQSVVTVVVGNIVKQLDCDGIVNAANSRLMAGGGVCGAIHAAAGPRLEPYATQFAPVAVGEAVATPGFDIPGCRYIIHTVGPKYHQDSDPAVNLARALRSAVSLADMNGIKRLAIPAISTGIYGYPESEAIPILVETAHELVAKLESVREIRFVVISEKMERIFLASMPAV
jgi:O-acetyl-ADP-ribose deacetylase (regulator of RNase III)